MCGMTTKPIGCVANASQHHKSPAPQQAMVTQIIPGVAVSEEAGAVDIRTQVIYPEMTGLTLNPLSSKAKGAEYPRPI